MIYGFPPVIGKNPKIMILGSMPSITSLEKRKYYGFKQNRFWKIIGSYFACEFSCYEDKLNCIKEHSILLWDVISHCEREGSLDSDIRKEVVNDIPSLLKKYPSIKCVICNGKKSYSLYKKHFSILPLEVFCLPSTSNANRTIKEEILIAKWHEVLRKYV